MDTNALIVFARRPALGQVKTRIAKTMGDAGALLVYEKLLDKTRETIQHLSASVFIYYSEQSGPEADWGRKVEVVYQQGRDLGARMQNAFQECLTKHERVVLVGSDCPGITPGIVNDAFEALNNSEVVLGPTEDGGYYLIGMKSLQNDLFENMMWSTSNVYEETIQRLENNDTSYLSLPLLFDVDEEEDYRRCLREGLL